MAGPLQNPFMFKSASGGGEFYTHQIAKSCRFIGSADDDGTNYMYHTRGTPTNVDKCTISAWVKRSKLGSKDQMFTGSGINSGNYSWLGFNTANEFYNFQAGDQPQLESNALFRDTNAWMHIVIANDSTQGTAANRNKIYINGVQYTDWGDHSTYSTQNADFYMNTSGYRLFVGSGGASEANSWLPFDGYIAEYVFIDGTQYAASDFGESKNGVWIPSDPSGLTFGNNGAYLKFESSSALGNDSSGNDNDFTVAAIAAHDQMLDSPTFNSDSNGGNFATYNPLTAGSYISLSEGNLQTTGTNVGDEGCALATMGVTSGKWYWEVRMIAMRYSVPAPGISAGSASATQATTTGGPKNLFYYAGNSTNFLRDLNSTIWGTVTEVETGLATFSAGDKMMIALDVDNKKVWYGRNGSWFNSGNPATGSNPQQSWVNTGFSINPSILEYDSSSSSSSYTNFGQDGTFAGTETAQGNADDTGYGNFFYDVPAGFLAMCSGNLPVADEIDPAQTDDNFPQKLFNSLLYTGTGGNRAITGLGFSPDVVWGKSRSNAENHFLADTSHGTGKDIIPDLNVAQQTENGVTAFGTDGWSMGSVYNANNYTYGSWSWRLNGGTEVSNSDGGIASTVQVDPSGGFSLVRYSGTGSASTVGHGLSSAPTWIFAKRYDASASWVIYTTFMTAHYYMTIDAGAMGDDAALWNDTNSTSSVFSVGTGGASNAGAMTAFCWANVEGYIKSGSYEGNGNANGTFVYTGFRPAFIICKSIDSGTSYQLFDDKRVGFNVDNNSVLVDTNDAEATTDMIDILSNGFKCRIATDPNIAETYIYLAIAKNPFKYATAR